VTFYEDNMLLFMQRSFDIVCMLANGKRLGHEYKVHICTDFSPLAVAFLADISSFCYLLITSPRYCSILTLYGPGEVKVGLADFDLKLQEKL
jgi:hypothetical protein